MNGHCEGCCGSILTPIYRDLGNGVTVGQDWLPCPGLDMPAEPASLSARNTALTVMAEAEKGRLDAATAEAVQSECAGCTEKDAELSRLRARDEAARNLAKWIRAYHGNEVGALDLLKGWEEAGR